MGIFSPFWKKEMDYRQKNYYRIVQQGEDKIAAMTDQALLKRIASESPEGRYRDAAVKKLGSQSDLLELYAVEKSEYIRQTIASKLKEGEDLYRIAKTDPSRDVRITAIKNITDEKVLADIIKKEKSAEIRAYVIKSEKIKDNNLLYELASISGNDNERYYISGVYEYSLDQRIELLKRITDKELIMRAVKELAEERHLYMLLKKLNASQLLSLALDEELKKKFNNIVTPYIIWLIPSKSGVNEHTLAEILSREKEYDRNSEISFTECIESMKDPECIGFFIDNTASDKNRIIGIKRLAAIDLQKASQYAFEMLPKLSDSEKFSMMKIIAKADPEEGIKMYLELTSENNNLSERWNAAVALIDLEPSVAVEPLVNLMRNRWKNRYDKNINMMHLTKATKFLTKYYKKCSSEHKAEIAGLPNGEYYCESYSGYCDHTDIHIHFDMSDI